MTFIDLVATAAVTGFGVSIGSAVSELWIKPHFEKLHKNGSASIRDLQTRIDNFEGLFSRIERERKANESPK